MKNFKLRKREEKKYGKLTVASFVLSIFIILNFLLIIIEELIVLFFENFQFMEFFAFLFSFDLFHLIRLQLPIIAPTASIVLGIAALIKIRENKNLKGKLFAILGVLIPILALLFYSFFFSLFLILFAGGIIV